MSRIFDHFKCLIPILNHESFIKIEIKKMVNESERREIPIDWVLNDSEKFELLLN